MNYEDTCEEVRSLLTQMLSVVPREHTPKLVRLEKAFGKLTLEIDALKAVAASPDMSSEDEFLAMSLTRGETTLLRRLRDAGNRGLSKEAAVAAAYAHVPNCDWPDLKIIDVRVCKLRQKLKASNAQFWIETVWGMGYRYHEGPIPVAECTAPDGKMLYRKPSPQYMHNKDKNRPALLRGAAKRRAEHGIWKSKQESIAA